ncbi:MAG: Ig-like domain-containing protein [Bacteroidales bacterium]
MIFNQQHVRSISAKAIILWIACILQVSIVNAQEEKGVTNNGAKIIVSNGAFLKITGATSGEASYTNRSAGGLHGRINLVGTIKLQGNWINEASSGNVILTDAFLGEVVFNGTTGQSIGGTRASFFEKVKIDNAAGLSLNTDQTIYGSLTLTNGTIVLNSSNLTIGSTGSIGGTFDATHMIITNGAGTLRKQFNTLTTFDVFPIGDNAGNYSPVMDYNLTAGSLDSAYVGAKVTNTKHPNNGSASQYLNRYWTLSESGITGAAYSANFKYVDADIVGTESSIYSAQFNGATHDLYAAVDATNNYVKVNNLSTFYDYTGVDGTAPGVTLSSDVPARTNAAFTVTFTFTENVTGFTIDGISVTNATKSGFSGTGDEYTATITPTTNNTTVTVKVNADAAQDAAGNNNTVSNTITTLYDNVKPGVTLTSIAPNPTNNDFVVRFAFTENVTGFDESKISTTNAGVSGFTSIKADSVWTALIEPIADGSVTVKVNAGQALDAAGNSNTVSNTITRTYDISNPTVNITSAESTITNDKPFEVTLTFNEKVIGLATTDLSLTNATASDLAMVGTDSLAWTVNISPGIDGAVNVSLPINKVNDLAGNGNLVSNLFSITYDGTKPDVNITSAASDSTNTTFTVTVEFTEDITGFTVDDIDVVNGTAGAITPVVANKSWTSLITPDVNGLVTVDVADGAATDDAGNTNNAADQFSIIYDIAHPTISSLYPTDNQVDVSANDNLQITFNEKVDIGTGNIEIRTVSPDGLFESISVASLTGGTTITINPVGTFGSSVEYYVTIPSTAFVDPAGNKFAGILNNTDWTFTTADSNKPIISNLSPADGAVGVSVTTNLVITFSENIFKGTTGNITIKKSDNTLIETIAVTSTQVSISNAVVTIDLTSDLSGQTGYFVLIDATCFKDDGGNYFVGIVSPDYWNFTTEDIAAPVVSVLNPLNGAVDVNVNSNLVITFNENVAKGTGNITIMNAETSLPYDVIDVASVSVTGSVVTINPSIDFESETNYYVLIDNNAIKDLAGNYYAGISANNIWAFKSKDVITPTVTVSSSEPDPTNSAFEVLIEFSEPVQNFAVGDISLGNGGLSGFTTANDSTFKVIVTPNTNGTETVQVTAAVCQDLAGNNNSASNVFEIEFDNIQPTTTISSIETSPTNTSAFDIEIDFSEEVSGFESDDISVINGTAGGFVNVNNAAYTAIIAPTNDGLVKLNINSGVATDEAGNDNLAATEYTFIYDGTKPTVVVSSTEPDPTNNIFEVLIEFSEIVQNFAIEDINPDNGSLSGFTTINDSTFTVDVTPLANGTVTVQVMADGCNDLAGNNNTASNIFEIEYDITQPTVSITSNETSPVYNSPFTITITFSEEVLGFTLANLDVVNGYKSNLFTANNVVYTADITPIAIGSVTANIAADLVTDIAGNGNIAADEFSITFAGTKPSVTISSAISGTTNISPISIDIEFSEPVMGLEEIDFELVNCSVSGLQSISSSQYNLNISPLNEGVVSILLPADKVENSISNGNTASNTYSITYDLTAPTVGITSTASNPTNNSPIPVSILFSEEVSGFNLGDITFTNGSSTLLTTSDSTEFTLNVIPGADGAVLVNISSDVCTDLAGNNNTAATQLSRTYDGTAPTVAITSSASDTTNVSPIPVTITFSEAVTGFVLSDITFTNGSSTSLNTSDSITFTLNVITDDDGAVLVNISSDVCTDLAGNNNTAAIQFTRTFDGTAPDIEITSTAIDPTYVSPIPVTITFSEAVTGFELNDILITNGSAPLLNTSDNIIFTLNVTPTADGTVSLDINSGVCTDLTGNTNTAATQFSITFDNSSPTVAITSTESSPTTSNSIPLTITFSETVIGFINSDITVGNGTISELTNTDNEYTATLIPQASGTVTVNIAAGVATDLAGNGNTAASQFSIIYNPTVGIDKIGNYLVSVYAIKGTVIIEIKNPENTQFQKGNVEIFNLLGLSIVNKPMDDFGRLIIPIYDASSVYIVKITIDGNEFAKRVFVNKE